MAHHFRRQLLAWFDQHGRHDLPWQSPRDPYRVWLSEIMLQQTQVATVIPYFVKFIARFPCIQSLSAAPIDDVLSLWAGLGYYTRAKNLHRAARLIVERGEIPQDLLTWMTLPGIGRSTAGAIIAQAYNQYGVILDGNVRRVLIRVHALHGDPSSPLLQKSLWDLAEKYTPHQRSADYAQAIMDLGAMICTRSKPRCSVCPFKNRCLAYAKNETALLPTKRLKKVIPLKTTVMLVIRNTKQQILLNKRPMSGLWNGLWCLPMLDSQEHLTGWLMERSFSLTKHQVLTDFRHTFSHFALDISSAIIDIKTKKSVTMDTDSQWFSLEQALTLGIPAPIKKILTGL